MALSPDQQRAMQMAGVSSPEQMVQAGITPNPVQQQQGQQPQAPPAQAQAAPPMSAQQRASQMGIQRPGVPPVNQPERVPGASIVEGMATAIGRQDLAGLMQQNRVESARVEGELNRRQQNRQKNLMEMYKLDLALMSPLERDVKLYSSTSDPQLKRALGLKLGFTQPRPTIDPKDYKSISAFQSWMNNNPGEATAADARMLAANFAEYQRIGAPPDIKEGGIIVEHPNVGINIADREPPEGRQFPSEVQTDMWGKADNIAIKEGQINDRAMMTHRERSDPYSEMVGGSRVTKNTEREPLTKDEDWSKWKEGEAANLAMRSDLVELATLMQVDPEELESGSGTEWYGKHGARMSTIWTRILGNWRRAEAAGALDQGTISVFSDMLGNPGKNEWGKAWRNIDSIRAQEIHGNIEEMLRGVEQNRNMNATKLSTKDKDNWYKWNMRDTRSTTNEDVMQYLGATVEGYRTRAMQAKGEAEADELEEKIRTSTDFEVPSAEGGALEGAPEVERGEPPVPISEFIGNKLRGAISSAPEVDPSNFRGGAPEGFVPKGAPATTPSLPEGFWRGLGFEQDDKPTESIFGM